MAGIDKRPRVSFVVPAFNAGALWLGDSVRSLLRQTVSDIEVIVVDDGSTDGSVAQVAGEITDRRVRWLRQVNSGKSVAMNRGVEEARADFVAVQDADDLADPRRAEIQLAEMGDPEVGMVFCGHYLMVGNRRMAPQVLRKEWRECRRLLNDFRMPGHDPTMMARRSLLLKTRYRVGLTITEGLDIVLRLGEQCEAVNVGGPFYGYRIHPASITKVDPLRRQQRVQEVLRDAGRRRGDARFENAWPSAAPRADNGLYADFSESVKQLKRCGRRWSALRCGFDGIRLAPFDWQYYKPLVHSLLP